MPRPARLLALTAALVLVPSASAVAKDHDRDGLPDRWERQHHAKKAKADPDDDALSNRNEFLAGTDPHEVDTDGDDRPDGDEDRDRDGVDNATEQQARTSPRDKDSDGDGKADGAEDPDRDRVPNRGESLVGFHPRDADSDDDDVADGDERAGTITSVAGGVLTVDLVTGGRLSAAYDEFTSVACDEEDAGDDGAWEDGDDDAFEDEDEAFDDDGDGDDADDDADDLGDLDDAGAGDAEDADPCLAQLVPGAITYETELDEDDPSYVVFVDLVGE